MYPVSDTRFKPGQSPNPGGRPKLPDDVRRIRMLNQVGFIRMANRFCSVTQSEATALKFDPTLTMIERAVLSQVDKASKGDNDSFRMLIERLIGKAPDNVLTTDGERVLAEMSDQELIQAAKDYIKQIEEAKQ